MLGTVPAKTKNKYFKSPHFWAIIIITTIFMLIYSAWPWRTWGFSPSLLLWFPWLYFLYNLALFEVMNHLVGILFFIPIIYAAIVFSWQGSLIVCLLSLGRVLPIILGTWSISSMLVNIALLMLPFLLVSIITIEFQWRRKERKVFVEREQERQIYISRVLDAQENERKRIAMDLHDETIQTLIALANNAEMLTSSENINIAEMKKKVGGIRDTTIELANDLRKVSLDLRPGVLDNLGLVPALRWLIDRMNHESNISTKLQVNGQERKLSPETEVIMFRVIQEALNNIKRHSKAKTAVINLEFKPEELTVTIQDDGQGFFPQKDIGNYASKGKLGLIGMQERVNYLGGKIQIHSKPGEGTILFLEARC